MKKSGGDLTQQSWRMWVLTLLALALATFVLSLLTQQNAALSDALREGEQRLLTLSLEGQEDGGTCDVLNRCLFQSNENFDWVYGVARITAHTVGTRTFEGIDGEETCTFMKVDSANDFRVPRAFGEDPVFAVSYADAEIFASTTSDAPASMFIYLEDMPGYGRSACDPLVHVIEYSL